MATTFSTRTYYDVSAERLFELITDPSFLERKALDFGATAATITRRVEPDETVVVVSDIKRPAHWGSGEDHSEMTVRFERGQLHGTWDHRQFGVEGRSKVGGRVEIIARGDSRCEYLTEGSLEIDVPLIGRRIERQIKKGIEAGAAKEQAYIRRALQATAA